MRLTRPHTQTNIIQIAHASLSQCVSFQMRGWWTDSHMTPKESAPPNLQSHLNPPCLCTHTHQQVGSTPVQGLRTSRKHADYVPDIPHCMTHLWIHKICGRDHFCWKLGKRQIINILDWPLQSHSPHLRISEKSKRNLR